MCCSNEALIPLFRTFGAKHDALFVPAVFDYIRFGQNGRLSNNDPHAEGLLSQKGIPILRAIGLTLQSLRRLGFLDIHPIDRKARHMLFGVGPSGRDKQRYCFDASYRSQFLGLSVI